MSDAPFLERLHAAQMAAAQREDYDSAQVIKLARWRLQSLMLCVSDLAKVDAGRIKLMADADEDLLMMRCGETTEQALARIIGAYLSARGDGDAADSC